MIEGTFTVLFEYPFWVGIAERHDERGYSVARIVYGSEPNDEMIISSIRDGYRALVFSKPTPEPPPKPQVVNYKRLQRKLHHLLEEKQEVRPEVIEALKLERERQGEDRKRKEKAEREIEAERKYRLHQEKNKDKKRGH